MANKHRRYDRVFWIEVEKIKPNPMQPRRDFDEAALSSLADSIRQYGVLQPLVVTRIEKDTPTGTAVEYELVSGERRWRASARAGLNQVPVVIRDENEDKLKLELAIIENLQREDLNPIDRAMAFKKLVDTFNLRHREVAQKVGKSREYVTNSIRLLGLPEEIQASLIRGEISEGHCRTVLMASSRPEEQINFYKKIVENKLSVRAAERFSRSLTAEEKVNKPIDLSDTETVVLEENLSKITGGVVRIERSQEKGRISIDFISTDDLRNFLERLKKTSETDEKNSNNIGEPEEKIGQKTEPETEPEMAMETN